MFLKILRNISEHKCFFKFVNEYPYSIESKLISLSLEGEFVRTPLSGFSLLSVSTLPYCFSSLLWPIPLICRRRRMVKPILRSPKVHLILLKICALLYQSNAFIAAGLLVFPNNFIGFSSALSAGCFSLHSLQPNFISFMPTLSLPKIQTFHIITNFHDEKVWFCKIHHYWHQWQQQLFNDHISSSELQEHLIEALAKNVTITLRMPSALALALGNILFYVILGKGLKAALPIISPDYI